MTTTTLYGSDALAEQNFLNGMMGRLRRRKLLITILTVVFFAILFLGIELLPKSYRGVASVEIEGQTPTAAQTGRVTQDSPFDDQTIGTELAILQTRELLVDTINRTHLLNDPEFNPTLHRSLFIERLRNMFSSLLPAPDTDVVISPSDKAMEDTLDTLRAHIALTPIPHSRVISIAVTARDNVLAANIANAIADLYLSNQRKYKQDMSAEAKSFLAGQIDSLKEDAANKQRVLEQYRIDHGLTMATAGTLVQEQVTGLNTQLQQAQVQLAGLEAQAQAAKTANNPESLAEVISSATITKYREQEGVLVAQQARLVAAYGSRSPMLGQIDAQLAQIRAAISAEAHRSMVSLSTRLNAARQDVVTLTKQLDTVRGQAKETDAARAKLQTLMDDATSAQNVYAEFQGRLRAIDASMAYSATNIRVVSHAAPSTRPSFPNYLIMLPASLVLSMFAAGTIAYTTARPRGLSGATEIAMLYDIRDLGMIPIRTPKTEGLFTSKVQQLLNRLYYLSDVTPKSIMITSALPQEGKTTTAQALAEEAMQRGIKVFLVDADMRSKKVLRAKTSAPQIGLADVLRDDADVMAITQKTKAGVPMIPSGSKGNPTRLMALPSMGKVIKTLTEQYELVIVDAPPVLIGGDCEMLSRVVDSVVMLAKWHSTDPETISYALKQLDPERVAGGVVTMVDPYKMGQSNAQDAVVFSKHLHRYYNQA